VALLLAIETSCDETAVGIFDTEVVFEGGSYSESILAEGLASSAKLHEAYGGIVPELAAREQIVALPPLLLEALKAASSNISEIKYIAATAGPGLNGSLLVGLSLARGLAYGLGVPLIPINHLEGHLAAHELLPVEDQLAPPYISLLASGGHTEVILTTKERSRKTLARTRDDAAGEAFDKCASLLGLPYPGGPALSALAKDGDLHRYNFPIGVQEDEYSFSFSGLKTAVAREISKAELNDQRRKDLAAGIQGAIVDALVKKSINLALKSGASGIFVTGGVAANSHLRRRLATECLANTLRFAASDLEYTTDNATMIGAAALNILLQKRELYERWKPGKELGPGVAFDISTRTAWPVG